MESVRMARTALVDTEGLAEVPLSFALVFAFLAASRFFFESDTISAVGAQACRLCGSVAVRLCTKPNTTQTPVTGGRNGRVPDGRRWLVLCEYTFSVNGSAASEYVYLSQNIQAHIQTSAIANWERKDHMQRLTSVTLP